MKRLLFILALALLAGAFFLSRGDRFERLWHRLLIVSVPMSHADGIIVLGGEPLARPTEAASLYKEGVAPRVFVTGTGDAASCRKVLMGAGVPASAIIVEPKATTTYANATLLKPLLEESNVTSALIVTSPFHTRRALATFRKVMPGIRFGVTDASIGWWGRPEGRGDLNRFVWLEFLKTAEYWVLYGVKPFLRPETGNLRPEI
jgi:uncharacterized SAM-binding protein YcdF (DUF218 family)